MPIESPLLPPNLRSVVVHNAVSLRIALTLGGRLRTWSIRLLTPAIVLSMRENERSALVVRNNLAEQTHKLVRANLFLAFRFIHRVVDRDLLRILQSQYRLVDGVLDDKPRHTRFFLLANAIDATECLLLYR